MWGRSCRFQSSSATKAPHILSKVSPPGTGADIAPELNAGHFLTRQKMRGSDLPDTRGPYSTQEAWSPRGAGKEETGEHVASPGLLYMSFSPAFRPVFCPFLSLPSSSPSSLWVSQPLSVFISATVSVFPTSRLPACLLPLLLPSSRLSQPLLQAQTQSLLHPHPTLQSWKGCVGSFDQLCGECVHSLGSFLCMRGSLLRPLSGEASA